MRHRPARLWTVAGAAVLAAASLVASGCGGGAGHAQAAASAAAPPKAKPAPATHKPAASAAPKSSASKTASAVCTPVSSVLERRILGKVVLDGATLLHAEAFPAQALPGYYFVSSRVDGSGTRNQLATWATKGLDGHGKVFSVDSFAALISQYAAAQQFNVSLGIKAPGAYRSRVCAGGNGASHGVPAPSSGIGNSAQQN
jgi:hypothetical protein